jgi:hypothetical protein
LIQTQPFTYHHLIQPRVFNDVRKTQTSKIELKECQFLGFRIRTPEGDRYHHALILVDEMGSFYDGIAAEFKVIVDQIAVMNLDDIELIFVRTLLLEESVRPNIDRAIRHAIASKGDSLFVVYGLLDEQKSLLMEVNSQNAMAAMEAIGVTTLQEYGKSFKTLEVTLAHPIIDEFNRLFDGAIERFELLRQEELNGSIYLH